jgi:hypothetical protein
MWTNNALMLKKQASAQKCIIAQKDDNVSGKFIVHVLDTPCFQD